MGLRIMQSEEAGGLRGGKKKAAHYYRSVPGRLGESTRCGKPSYTKRQRAAMAERPTVKNFQARQALAQEIYHDETQYELWAEKHRAAIQEQRRHGVKKKKDGSPVIPIRLWDYVKKFCMDAEGNIVDVTTL